jgi:hypothetical protein
MNKVHVEPKINTNLIKNIISESQCNIVPSSPELQYKIRTLSENRSIFNLHSFRLSLGTSRWFKSKITDFEQT